MMNLHFHNLKMNKAQINFEKVSVLILSISFKNLKNFEILLDGIPRVKIKSMNKLVVCFNKIIILSFKVLVFQYQENNQYFELSSIKIYNAF